ncbi:hypothetical protein C4553_03510 [Candidatus Parcubacteria bacterium]|nr:MAG: hypothetical protein C4553_03510 [Candidatus Parcubacteria bacterium]
MPEDNELLLVNLEEALGKNGTCPDFFKMATDEDIEYFVCSILGLQEIGDLEEECPRISDFLEDNLDGPINEKNLRGFFFTIRSKANGVN